MQYANYRSKLALLLSLALVGLLAGCGGGGGTAASQPPTTPTPTPTATGIALPQEVSAIPANNGTASVQTMGLRARFQAVADAASQLPMDSDYQTAITSRFVDEPALQVFDIIDTILKAVAQTHYADSGNVNAGPYKAMVAWYDDEKGQTVKQMQTWIINSQMVDGSNIVSVWPQGDNMPGAVEVKIDQAPTRAADGSYSDYGKWSISAKFDPDGNYYFVARADIDNDGMTVLTINQKELDDVGGYQVKTVTKATVHKADGSGYGQIKMPKYEACDPNNVPPGETNPCASGSVPEVKVEYAYNQAYVTYEKFDSNDNPIAKSQIFKDRDQSVDMAYQYGLYDADGSDVQKAKSFGFPVTYTDGDGTEQAYYGSWQGLHQLWTPDGSTVQDGTAVTRADVPPEQSAPSYTVKSFPGSFAKRTLVGSDIGQLLNLPVQAFINNNLTLVYDGANNVWDECVNPDWSTYPMSCGSTSDFTSQLGTLTYDPTHQRMIFINGMDQSTNPPTPVMYAYDGTGFLLADQTGAPTSTPYTPLNGDVLNVNIGGSIYIEYTGSGAWVQKTLTGFDQQTNTPSFDDSQDMPFDFPIGMQYELNNNGVNFIVKRTATTGAASDYTTSMEIQMVANPVNAATVVNHVAYFKPSWDDSPDATTYTFDTTAGDANYLMLVYRHVSQQDQQRGHAAGAVVTEGAYGLFAYDTNDQKLLDSSNNPIMYNWQYAASPGDWGTATYLVDGNGQYKLLDDPIMLQPVQLTAVGGDTLNFSLQYDGYMHGLPDMHQQLQHNNNRMTPDIADKIVNIPAGTQVADETGNIYYIKPLQIGVILPIVTASDIDAAGKTAPDLSTAALADLSTVPAFVDPNLPDAPTDAVLKYAEGIPVQ